MFRKKKIVNPIQDFIDLTLGGLLNTEIFNLRSIVEYGCMFAASFLCYQKWFVPFHWLTRYFDWHQFFSIRNMRV